MHSIISSVCLIAIFVIPMGFCGHLHIHHGHGHGGLAGGGGGGGIMNMGQFRSGHTGYIRPRLHGDIGHVRHHGMGPGPGMRSLLSEGMMSHGGRGFSGSAGPGFRSLDPRRPHIHSHGMF